jgi:hypothetical protein
MIFKRVSMFTGAAFSALALSVSMSAPASAASGYSHIWNNSAAVNRPVPGGLSRQARRQRHQVDLPPRHRRRSAVAGHLRLGPPRRLRHRRRQRRLPRRQRRLDGPGRPDRRLDLRLRLGSALDHRTEPGLGVRIVANQHSGLCMAVYQGSLANGTHLIQWLCNETPDEQWASSDGSLQSKERKAGAQGPGLPSTGRGAPDQRPARYDRQVRSWGACRGSPSSSCGPASCCRSSP